jgi:hypothetical protein
MILQIASTFTAAPISASLERTLVETGVVDGLGFVAYSRVSEYMLTPPADWSQIAGTLVLVRVEDWVRDLLKSTPPATGASAAREEVRRTLRVSVDAFVNQLSSLAERGKQVWFLACPSNGWISERHKIGVLCRTYTNLLTTCAEELSGVTTLPCPPAWFAEDWNDRGADRLGQLPFTQETFDRLGAFAGGQIAGTLRGGASDLGCGVFENSPALAAYLESLRVQVQLTTADQSHRSQVDRFLRTAAAFTLTGEKRDISEAEIDALLESESCLLVNVSDRFSDHGPSGLVTFRQEGNSLVVRAMALSCAVLAKQVEHAVLAALIKIAAGRSCRQLEFQYRASERNQPMLGFLMAVAGNATDGKYVLPLDAAEARLNAAAVSAGAWTVEISRDLENSSVHQDDLG